MPARKQHIISSNPVKGLLLLLALTLGGTIAGQAQVRSYLDTTQIRIGEEIKYIIEVEADTTDLVIFPEGQSFLPLEVIESYKIDTSFADVKTRLIKKYGLTQFDSGAYSLPSQRVYINDRAYTTDSAKVYVQDVAVDTTQQKMFDIKPAISVDGPPVDLIKLLAWLVPILIILGIAVYWFLKRRKIQLEESQRMLPPYEEAITALKELDDTGLLRENRSKEYYSKLTEIVKRYLDREVDDRALESTSGELIERLQLHKDAGHFEFDNATIKKLDDILRRADLVKFAKMQQMEGQASNDRSSIEQIIKETKEVIPEPSEEELRENEEYMAAIRKKKVHRQWIYGISGVLALLIVSGVLYGTVAGFQSVKNIFIKNDTQELAEGNWIRSEYGNPAIILETPDALLRKVVDAEESSAGLTDQFTFGDMRSLFIMVNTARLNPEKELKLEEAMEATLVYLEEEGATNMIVKQGAFETEKGITGLKSFGEFRLKGKKEELLPVSYSYEVLLFGQQGGLQQLIISYPTDDSYAEDIKDRILRSVELEITEGGAS